MARGKIPQDAIVSDIYSGLDDKDQFLRNLYHNMCEYRKVHGSVFVTIGISGRGHYPNYRLSPDEETRKLEMDNLFASFGEGKQNPAIQSPESNRIYDGKNHKVIEHQYATAGKIGNARWSSKSSGFDEIERIFKDHRNL